MTAVDPSFPLYPVASFVAAFMLLLVLLTGFARQSWNLGVTFLCLWLFLEVLTGGINAILWSDNADLKLYVYCDIVSHVQEITTVVKPMATLLISRRLYIITSLRSVKPESRGEKRRDLAIELILGLGVPLLVAGPLYYVAQSLRFGVFAGFGCQDSVDGSIVGILLVDSWGTIPPLISVAFYFPRVIRMLYRQKRDIDRFLQSNFSVSRRNYYRIFALASLDVLLTLPIGITSIVLIVTSTIAQIGYFPVYGGWAQLHDVWGPIGFSYATISSGGPSTLAVYYFTHWTSPVLAFVIFGLFGLTGEARTSYQRIVDTIRARLGWKADVSMHGSRSLVDSIRFDERPRESESSFDPELGSRPSSVLTDGHMMVETISIGAKADEQIGKTEDVRELQPPSSHGCQCQSHDIGSTGSAPA